MMMLKSSSHPEPVDLRALRHDILGCMNALVLSAAALDETAPPHTMVEFLTHLETSAEKLLLLLDQLDRLT